MTDSGPRVGAGQKLNFQLNLNSFAFTSDPKLTSFVRFFPPPTSIFLNVFLNFFPDCYC